MAPTLCTRCNTSRALIIRPKNHQKLCRPCFISIFEDEIHNTITSSQLFKPGDRIAIGASGGKDSTVLASILKTLNERHKYGLELVLLSIDEGIKGYRDDSLKTVKRNASQYDMPLKIVSYDELYGWTMDRVVDTIGKKGNCTYCGVFRRQALDRGADMLGINHVVTGHNADDVAETIMMNLLRGDLPRLSRSTSIVTGDETSTVRRSKPLKYAYEKEIVLYAYHMKLEYFSTECIYSPEAFRGSARTLIKNLERVRPSAILDIVRSGEDMARLMPKDIIGGLKHKGSQSSGAVVDDDDDDAAEGSRGCGNSNANPRGEMAEMERKLREDEEAATRETQVSSSMVKDAETLLLANGQPHDRLGAKEESRKMIGRRRIVAKQTLGNCQICGYMASQKICKACVLLEGLSKTRSRSDTFTDNGGGEQRDQTNLVQGTQDLAVKAG